MITQVFTFGYGHVCPFTGRKLDDHYATVVAADQKQARALMVAAFGTMWCDQYESVAAAMGGYPIRLVEHVRLELTSPTPLPEPSGTGETSAAAATTPADIAQYISDLDQQTAVVRDLAARVRRHWVDDSGCPLPKCPSGTLVALVEGADPDVTRGLLLAALVMLADRPDPMPPAPGQSSAEGICGAAAVAGTAGTLTGATHVHRCARRVDPTTGTHLGQHHCGACRASYTTGPDAHPPAEPADRKDQP